MNTFEGHKTADRGAVSSSRAVDKPQIVRLAVVVVTYQTRELLREFLLSLRSEIESLTGVAVNVVVVDNASTDGTVEMVRDEFPEVRVVANAANLGPARAFNQGLAEVLSDADVVLLANSDIYIHAGTLKRMIEFLGSHPEVDGCCGRLYNPDGTPQVTRTRIVSLWPVSKDKPHRATFPGTTFSMIRASAFARIGGFDETYYFYNEDLDWAERARRAGLRFEYIPEASVTHYGSQGRRHNVSRIRRELYRANLYYYRRHYPALAPLAYLGQLLALRWGQWLRRRWLEKLSVQRGTTGSGGRSDETTEVAVASEVASEAARWQQELADLEAAIARLRAEYRNPTAPRIPTFEIPTAGLRLTKLTPQQAEMGDAGPGKSTG